VTGAPHDVAQRGIARTFQNIELFEHATVLQNLLIGRHRHRVTNLFEECCSCRACAAPRSRSARRSSA
jgi:ABC-type branched-subunit amino acid transport system ATPase component